MQIFGRLFVLSVFVITNVTNVTALDKRQTSSQITTVNLATNLGPPAHLASGFIYGIPDTANQIPDHFYTDIGFNYARAGGAQVAAPGRGWIWGITEYLNRFASVLSNYKTARKYNAQFIFLIHDLWGADGSQNSSAPYPGDNGVWTFYDQYLTQLIADINTNDMTAGLKIDIWNEPDISIFWARSQTQWLEMYGRAFARFRSAFPTVQLFGPTLATMPTPSNTWWTSYLSFIKTNNSIPDAYVWHLEGSTSDVNDDPQTNSATLAALLISNGLPTRPINIDEYGIVAEQVPGGAAWWISRLERYNWHGLRGNWLSGAALHDFMASLLGKPNAGTSAYSPTAAGYWANGEYQVYKYYNLNMTGHRVSSTGSIDRLMDSYGVVGTDRVRILVGGRQITGTYQLTINGLTAVGLPSVSSLTVRTWQFSNTGGHFGEVDAPTNLGTVAHTYTGGSVSFPIFQTDTTTTWAFEFAI